MNEKAKESRQVKRAREKLKKTLENEHEHFSHTALQEMAKRIRSTIMRHHPEPAFLKKRKFTLFDENKHTAQAKSKQVIKLQNILKQGLTPPTDAEPLSH